MTDPLIREIDPATGTFDKLYSPRIEAWFHPSPDGTPSLAGKIRFYAQWWHFRDNAAFAQSRGPQIEHEFDALMGRSWELPDGSTVTTATLLAGMEAVFRTLAAEHVTPSGD